MDLFASFRRQTRTAPPGHDPVREHRQCISSLAITSIHQANPAHGSAPRREALPAAIAPERRRRSLSAGRFFATLLPVISLSFSLGTGMIAARRDPRDDLRFRRLLARY